MSLLSKIFALISVFTVIVFLFLAASLVAQQEKFKRWSDSEQVELQRDIRLQDRLRQQLAATFENKKAGIVREREALLVLSSVKQRSQDHLGALMRVEDLVAEKVLRFTPVTSEFAAIAESYNSTLEELRSRIVQIIDMKDDVEVDQAQLWEALARDQAVVAHLREELNVLDVQLYMLTQQNRERRQRIQLYREIDPALGATGFAGPSRPVGEVRLVDAAAGVVIINIGNNEDVQPRQVFAVYDGTTYLGQVQVIVVLETSAQCRIMEGTNVAQLRVGNTVRPPANHMGTLPTQGR